MTVDDWLTPKTVIGARLPCGATVVSAEWLGHLCFNRRVVTVDFDKAPKGRLAQSGWLFFTDGVNYRNVIADLIPPAPVAPPQPEGVYVTREAWDSAIKKLDEDWSWRELEVALGVPPAPPKVAPWEAAYEAWQDKNDCDDPRSSWIAAVEWCVGQANEEFLLPEIKQGFRRRITGDDA